MAGRESFIVGACGDSLGGWLAGSGTPVLALAPWAGLSFSYLEDLTAELDGEFRVASFQQRGLEPSTLEGSFTVDQAHRRRGFCAR
jgi:hypothetical protein